MIHGGSDSNDNEIIAGSHVEESSESNETPFALVGIGASAGGLEALQEFFDNVQPSDLFAYIVVQHLSPDYKSLMPELLSRHTSLPVRHIEDGVRVKPGEVYILPPKKNLSVFQGKLFLTPQEPNLNLPIDMFFASLAEEHEERAVGVVLSGTGSDGTRGVRAIKEHGGMVMVQDEGSASFDGMPKSAIATGVVDYILPPEKMPDELFRVAQGHLRQNGNATRITASSGILSKILSLVKIKTGMDFSYYKENTIVRRIERRMTICQCETPSEYLEYLNDNTAEIQILHREFLIGVTRFFRDPEAFETVKDKILPEIFNSRNPGDPIRVWVAGCSTGEEAYSIAILLNEYCISNSIRPDIKIFATDIDRSALEVAAQGIYPLSIAVDASMERLGRYFFKKGEGYQIQPQVRKQVIFAHHNIIKDPPFQRTDLITCRNLLIYLQPVLQKKILANFQFSLNDNGFLFLGTSESVGDSASSLAPLSNRWKIYRYSGGHRPSPTLSFNREAPTLGNISSYAEPIGTPRQDEGEALMTQIMESCMPPTILVDHERSIQHIFGEIDDFLQLKAGRPQMDILKMARDSISIPLGSALQKAVKTGKKVRFPGVGYKAGGVNKVVDIVVRVFTKGYSQPRYSVTFESSRDDNINYESVDIDESVRSRINDLEQELQFTKENLQATIEELETSNEELQATNEELLASNEELQSTNEELQSVNEELITVNSEYQSKIRELTELNEDMDSLMAATDVGIVFLDRELVIRRYTEAATRIFRIIESDVGRPIGDLSHAVEIPSLIEDLRSCLSQEEIIEREIRDTEGNFYVLKIIPHESREARTKGVLLALMDITRPKQAEEALRREHNLFLRVMDHTPVATTMVDGSGRLSFANIVARELLGIKEDEVGNLSFNDEKFMITDLQGNPVNDDDLPFMQVKRRKECVVDFRHRIVRNGESLLLSVTGCPVFDSEDMVDGAVFKIEAVNEDGE